MENKENQQEIILCEAIENKETVENNDMGKICPVCGFKNKYDVSVCVECNYTFVGSKKKKVLWKIIVLLLALVLLGVGLFFGVKQYQINKSTEAHLAAVAFEENHEYENAIAQYSLVIEDDKENYENAQEKIVELNDLLKFIKLCAKAWVATDGICSYFDADNIRNIYYAENNSAYSMMYGEGTVSIVSPFMSTDCTYIISTEKNINLESQFPVYYNSEFNLYVHAIGTENYTKGWLSNGWDVITDTYITMAKQNCVEVDIDCVEKYVDLYYKEKDIKIFE